MWNPVALYSPVLDEWNVNCAAGSSRAHVEGPRSPEQGDSIGCVVGVQRGLFEEGLHKLRQLKLFIIIRQWFLTLLIPTQIPCRTRTPSEHPTEVQMISLKW